MIEKGDDYANATRDNSSGDTRSQSLNYAYLSTPFVFTIISTNNRGNSLAYCFLLQAQPPPSNLHIIFIYKADGYATVQII